MRMPVWRTIVETWTTSIRLVGVLWLPLGLTVLVLTAVTIAAAAAHPIVRGFVGACLAIPLIMIIHNQILRGRSSLGEAVYGPDGTRFLWYALDVLVIGLLLGVFILLTTFLGMFVALSLPSRPLWVMLVGTLAVAIAAAFLASLLILRLPARAIGEPISWREARRRAQPHLGRMVLVSLVVSLPLYIMGRLMPQPDIQTLLLRLRPSFFEALVSSIYETAQVLVLTAVVSLLYRATAPSGPASASRAT